MDRTVSMILQTPSIREVIAFPKNRSAGCPLTGAPTPVKREQLAELGLLDLGGKDVLPGAAQKEDRIDRVSWVARIGVAPEERPVMEVTLDQAEELVRLAAEKAGDEEPLYSVAPVADRTRPGVEASRSELAQSGELLKNAPSTKGDYFKVASILE